MKNFTEAGKSEAIRERSTQLASVQPCSFLELPLIYIQGIGGRSGIDSVEVSECEIYSTPTLTFHPTKHHRENSAPSAPAFQTKSEFAHLFRAWE